LRLIQKNRQIFYANTGNRKYNQHGAGMAQAKSGAAKAAATKENGKGEEF